MKNAITMLLIVAAMMGFVVFWDSPADVFISNKKAPPPALPKASSYMLNSKTSGFNELGLLAFNLETERGQFFEDQNKFIMDNPIIKANQGLPGEQAWQLTARTGIIFDHGKRIELIGDVHAWQYITTGLTELRTSKLTYYPDRSLARTSRRVTIKTPGSRITGVGMKANFRLGTLQLSSQVKSTHNAVN